MRQAQAAVDKNAAVLAFQQIAPDHTRAPNRLTDLRIVLDQSRESHREEVATIEAYLESSGFAAFKHGVLKRDRVTASSERTAHAMSGVSATTSGGLKTAGATLHAEVASSSAAHKTGISNLTVQEGELVGKFQKLFGNRSTKEARIRSIVEGTRLAARYADDLIGSTGFMHGWATLHTVHQQRNKGKGSLSVIDGENLLYPQYDIRNRFETELAKIRDPNRSSEDRKEAERPRVDGHLLHPKSARGLILGLRAMFSRKLDYNSAGETLAHAMRMGANVVAEKVGASKEEITEAARRYLSEERHTKMNTLFLLSSEDVKKKGEKWVRAEFEKTYKRMLAAARPEAKRQLETSSAIHVHAKVWNHWIGLAGGKPGVDTRAVKNAEKALQEARSMSEDGGHKDALVSSVSSHVAALKEAVAGSGSPDPEAIARTAKALGQALDQRVRGPLTTEQTNTLAQADAEMREVAAAWLSRRTGRPIDTIAFGFAESHVGQTSDGVANALATEATRRGMVMVAPFNDGVVYALPHEIGESAFARWRAQLDAKSGDNLADRAIIRALVDIHKRAAEEIERTTFAVASSGPTRHPEDVLVSLDRVPRKGSFAEVPLRELRHADEILAFGRRAELAPRVKDAVLEAIRNNVYTDLMQPGTRPAWTVVAERLARV